MYFGELHRKRKRQEINRLWFRHPIKALNRQSWGFQRGHWSFGAPVAGILSSGRDTGFLVTIGIKTQEENRDFCISGLFLIHMMHLNVASLQVTVLESAPTTRRVGRPFLPCPFRCLVSHVAIGRRWRSWCLFKHRHAAITTAEVSARTNSRIRSCEPHEPVCAISELTASLPPTGRLSKQLSCSAP